MLQGKQYKRILAAAAEGDQLLSLLIKQYAIWFKSRNELNFERTGKRLPEDEWQHKTSVLFDTVAAFLTFRESFLKIDQVPLFVDDEGFTRPVLEAAASSGQNNHTTKNKVRIALEWTNQNGFKKYLVDVLCENNVHTAYKTHQKAKV